MVAPPILKLPLLVTLALLFSCGVQKSGPNPWDDKDDIFSQSCRDSVAAWLNANGRELMPSDTSGRLTPYRIALWALDFEMDTVRDGWSWPGERTDTAVVKEIDSLYAVFYIFNH